MTAAAAETPAKRIGRIECTDLECHDDATVIVADGIALCATAALAWYQRERIATSFGLRIQ